jgi:hypothetical protein
MRVYYSERQTITPSYITVLTHFLIISFHSLTSFYHLNSGAKNMVMILSFYDAKKVV